MKQNRPNYEASDNNGYPYVRLARVIHELPTPACRGAACAEATDADCLFELRRWDGGGAPLLRALVRSRESMETSIPLGKYAGTIKCGSSWYGAAEFGANSSVDRITAPLVFIRPKTGSCRA